LIFGLDKYDWVSMAAIRKGDDHDLAAAAHIDLELIPGEANISAEQEAIEQAKLLRASKIAKTFTVFLAVAFLVLWPMPMYGTGYIFSKKFFTGWVVVGIIWLIGSLCCVGVFPVWEGRQALYHTFRSIYLDVTGKQHPAKYHNSEAIYVEGQTEDSKDGADTPPASKEMDVAEKAGIDTQ
jgi:hypothetical protein